MKCLNKRGTCVFVYLCICVSVDPCKLGPSGLLFLNKFYSGCCRLKKQMALQSRVDQHSYNNPTIQPHEELAVRGFSMFSGQEDKR
jgi:hypothetical protein